MFAPVSVRWLKMLSGTSGAVTRRSMTTKATSRITATASRRIVVADVQPSFGACDMA